MIIEYYPIVEPVSKRDWRIKEYKKRIYDKLNREKLERGDFDLYKMPEVIKIIKRYKNCHRIESEMDALFNLNKILLRRQMERYYADRKTKQILQCH